MAVSLAVLGGLVVSFITPFVQSFVKDLIGDLGEDLRKDLAKSLYDRFRDLFGDRGIKKLPDRISKAITGGKAKQIAGELLEKGYVTEEEANLIKRMGDLRQEAEQVSRIVDEGRYSVEDVESLLTLAKLLRELTRRMSFEDLGTKYVMKDTRTGEEIEVVDERYVIALLLGFAGAAYTQLGMLETPEEKGQALEYDAEMKIVREISKPRERIRRTFRYPTYDEEYFKFKEKYDKLWNIHRKVKRIQKSYLDAAACFKTARSFVLQARRQEQKHKRMEPTSLEALVKNYMAESQFWTYHISPELPSVALELKELITQEGEKASTYMSRMKLTEADVEEFHRTVYIYSDFAAGYAGALQLFNEAIESNPGEEDLPTIKSRVELCQGEIAKHGGVEKPRIVVEEPEAIRLEIIEEPEETPSS